MFAVETNSGVTTLTLSHSPVNAISEEWIRSFDAKLDVLATEPRCGVLHIRSDQKVFCAGADLKEVRARMDTPDGADRMYAYVAGIQRLYARIERLPQVTVAEAKLGLPEVRLGLIPGAGGTQRLSRACDPSIAKRLILGAEIIDGVTAAKLGVVHWAVPRSELAQRAAEIVGGIASLPTEALAASKACIAAAGNSDRSGYTYELEFTRLLLNNADTRKRVDEFLGGAAEPSMEMKRGASR
jgi:enoyl-CoA hydratase